MAKNSRVIFALSLLVVGLSGGQAWAQNYEKIAPQSPAPALAPPILMAPSVNKDVKPAQETTADDAVLIPSLRGLRFPW